MKTNAKGGGLDFGTPLFSSLPECVHGCHVLSCNGRGTDDEFRI